MPVFNVTYSLKVGQIIAGLIPSVRQADIRERNIHGAGSRPHLWAGIHNAKPAHPAEGWQGHSWNVLLGCNQMPGTDGGRLQNTLLPHLIIPILAMKQKPDRFDMRY